MKKEQGFSSIEVLIAAGIAIVVLAGVMRSFTDVVSLNEKTVQMTDLEQNLRAGMNLLTRDFMNAGWGIPTGGISIPSGDGSTAVLRPGPPGTDYTFENAETIAAVNPGATRGPYANNHATDMVNILFADPLISNALLDSVGTNGASAVVNGSTRISGITNAVRSGDLIYFSNGLGNTLQCVTRVSAQTLYFQAGDAMNLNQPGAEAGSIMQIQSGGVFPTTSITRVWLISYYLDYTTDPQTPRLMRRINNRAPEPVALVMEDLQLSYDLVDGDTNPSNIKSPVDPYSPNQIRKANILLSGRSNSVIRNTQQYLRRSLTTQVSLRCLSFVDRY